MLTCIKCSKQKMEDDDDDDESAIGTPSTKDGIKSLTSQMKDMGMKVSAGTSSKQGKSSTPRGGGGNSRKGQWPQQFADFDAISESLSYNNQPAGISSTSSTPAWDFARPGGGARNDSRFTGPFGGRLDSISTRTGGDVVVEKEDEAKEWMAQVEPGVHITFVSLPDGGNDMKRIRFNRDMFNKWQAQRWWGENYDRIMELYNVQRFNQQDPNTPSRSVDGRDSTYSRLGSAKESPMMTPVNRDWTPRNYKPPSGNQRYFPSVDPLQQESIQHYNAGGGSSAYGHGGGTKGEMSGMEASRTTTSSRDEASASISNASDFESEWIEEDQPGVYITIRQLADGTRELRRVRFSREMFGETNAKQWWEENRDRIQSQYL